VRREQDGEALRQQHPDIIPLIIDVTKPDTVQAAAEKVRSQVGGSGLQGLVNNAGKVTLAPLEFMPIEVFEDHMQVNLVGALRVSQAFLPLLRAGTKKGRIVNISSQAGTVVFPLFGAYNASKFGLEAISDCLRYELYNQGIKVIVVKPGPVKTPIWSKGFESSTKVVGALPPVVRQLYGDLIDKITALSMKSEEGGVESQEVGDVIVEALTAEEPRGRYLIGKSATIQMVLRRLLPDKWWDPLVIRQLPGGPPPGDT